MAEKTKLEKCKDKCKKKCKDAKDPAKCKKKCVEKCKEKPRKDIRVTQSQNVTVNVQTGRAKPSKKARAAAPKMQPYDFLKTELNQYQTAMANQLNMLEQSRDRFMQERDEAEGVQRALFQNELFNVNRRMNQVFDNLSDRGINVGAILRESGASGGSAPPMGIPVGIPLPEPALVTQPPPLRTPPPMGIPLSGAAGFPAIFPSTSIQSQESRISQLESTGSTQPPPSIISSSEFESDPVFVSEVGRQSEQARRDEQARLEREGLAQQSEEAFQRLQEAAQRFRESLVSPPPSPIRPESSVASLSPPTGFPPRPPSPPASMTEREFEQLMQDRRMEMERQARAREQLILEGKIGGGFMGDVPPRA